MSVSRHPGQEFSSEWECEPVTVTVLDGNRLGIEVDDHVTILRAEQRDDNFQA